MIALGIWASGHLGIWALLFGILSVMQPVVAITPFVVGLFAAPDSRRARLSRGAFTCCNSRCCPSRV